MILVPRRNLYLPKRRVQKGFLRVSSSVEDTPITVVLQASRTSGPAPLSVHFHAVSTTHDTTSIDTWRELGYSFDFGSTFTDTWTYSGESTRYQRGAPIAVCVFETPGTYIVKCKARDSESNTDQEEITITVTDPDTVYSGTNTVCISTDTDMTGAPSGAQQLTNRTSWPTFSSNKRYLLRAGKDYQSFGSLNTSQLKDFQFGPFGSGADPILNSINVQSSTAGAIVTDPANWPDRGVFYDLDVRQGVSSFSARYMLFLRCTITATSTNTRPFSMPGSTFLFYVTGAGQSQISSTQRAAIEWPQHFHFVNCSITGGGSAVSNAAFVCGTGICFLGCEVDPTNEHCIRLSHNRYGLIAHNYLHGVGDTIRHLVKWHAEGPDDIDDFDVVTSYLQSSRYCVVSYNQAGFDEPTGTDWGMALAPQNVNSAAPKGGEGVEDGIIENNEFGFNFDSEMALGGRRLTTRGNTMDAGIGGTATTTTGAHAGGIPPGWEGPYYTGGAAITTEDPD